MISNLIFFHQLIDQMMTNFLQIDNFIIFLDHYNYNF